MKVTNIQSIYQKTIAFAAEHHVQQKMPGALTKDSTLYKEDQMDDSLNRILDLSREVAIVKLCDCITNL